ncbi:MAG: hypothetical protein ACPL07_04570, partial [Candidatus Bathyarchaeia archaeon]
MTRAFYFGFGEFGRRLRIAILKFFISERDLDADNLISYLMSYDFYPGHMDRKDLEREGLTTTSEGGVLRPEARRLPPSNFKTLPPPSFIKWTLEAGVGGFWPIAAQSILENFPDNLEEINKQKPDKLDVWKVEKERT